MSLQVVARHWNHSVEAADSYGTGFLLQWIFSDSGHSPSKAYLQDHLRQHFKLLGKLLEGVKPDSPATEQASALMDSLATHLERDKEGDAMKLFSILLFIPDDDDELGLAVSWAARHCPNLWVTGIRKAEQGIHTAPFFASEILAQATELLHTFQNNAEVEKIDFLVLLIDVDFFNFLDERIDFFLSQSEAPCIAIFLLVFL